VAHGVSDSLLTRAADVCLKERRPLILLARESPLSVVHLRNMLAAAQAGATVMPAAPPLYHRPKTVEEMVDQILARVLDHLGLEHELGLRWNDDRG
jgi:4-hydroxy-3-polyprenylbenzoate decarboxylase